MISYREFAVFESAGVAGSGSGDDHGDSSSSSKGGGGSNAKGEGSEVSEAVKVEYVEVSNFTIVNLAIRIVGPTHEERLTLYLLIFQALCSALAFFIRYRIAFYFYEGHALTEEEIKSRYAF